MRKPPSFAVYSCGRLLVPLGFLASKEAGVTPAYLMAFVIVVLFAAEKTGRPVAHAVSVGTPTVGAAEESRCAAANLSATGIIVVHGSEQTGTAFADLSSVAVIVVGRAEQTRPTGNFLFRHGENPPASFICTSQPSAARRPC